MALTEPGLAALAGFFCVFECVHRRITLRQIALNGRFSYVQNAQVGSYVDAGVGARAPLFFFFLLPFTLL